MKREEKLNGYDGFVEKFKPKRTTDDCYTPPEVYEALLGYIRANIYDWGDAEVIRPFFPGGDYENYDYPDNCVVIDNPPFSIFSKIVRFYQSRGVRFFLFGPGLTLFSGPVPGVTYIVANAEITYENGAVVCTAFVSNFYPGGYGVVVDGKLGKLLTEVSDKLTNAKKKKLTKRIYPDCVITPATLQRLAVRGIFLAFRTESLHFVRKLDNSSGGLYGGGFLLSERAAAERAAAERAAAERAAAERAAAERAAAERAAAERAVLSERELEIIRHLK